MRRRVLVLFALLWVGCATVVWNFLLPHARSAPALEFRTFLDSPVAPVHEAWAQEAPEPLLRSSVAQRLSGRRQMNVSEATHRAYLAARARLQREMLAVTPVWFHEYVSLHAAELRKAPEERRVVVYKGSNMGLGDQVVGISEAFLVGVLTGRAVLIDLPHSRVRSPLSGWMRRPSRSHTEPLSR